MPEICARANFVRIFALLIQRSTAAVFRRGINFLQGFLIWHFELRQYFRTN